MVPSIAQQLQSLRNTMAETVMPVLPADNGFVQEQAGLMLATLDWLSDVHLHAYRYEAAENADYRALLSALAPGDADVSAALAEPAPPAVGELVELDAVSAQNTAMKELVGRLFDGSPEAKALLQGISDRQGEREAAWFRMTGFPKDPGALDEILAG